MLLIKYEMKYKHEPESAWVDFWGKFKSSEEFVQFEIAEQEKKREIKNPQIVKIIQEE